jgi:hypothetical protein
MMIYDSGTVNEFHPTTNTPLDSLQDPQGNILTNSTTIANEMHHSQQASLIPKANIPL